MDIETVLRNVDFVALAEEAGARFNGRNSSRCPLHNGNNPTAFHLYQTQDGITRYHCFTNCPEGANGGDAIAFYMRWKQVDFKQALLELAARAGVVDDGSRREPPKPHVEPARVDPPDDLPCAVWQARAKKFLEYTNGVLWSDVGKPALDYLQDRGLSEETTKSFGLGYNPRCLFDLSTKWGIDANRVWCARGIVIPRIDDGRVLFVNIRRPLPGDALAKRIGSVKDLNKTKFAGIGGGKRGLFGVITGKPILIQAEGEFDAMLAHQFASDFCDVMTLGGARHRLDARDAAKIAGASIIISILDTDSVGERGSAYMASVSPRVQLVQPPDHDLTDAWKRGVDLRAWLGGLVASKMEGLMNNLHREPPDDWLVWYQSALDAESKCAE